jgi:hypothetical protein
MCVRYLEEKKQEEFINDDICCLFYLLVILLYCQLPSKFLGSKRRVTDVVLKKYSFHFDTRPESSRLKSQHVTISKILLEDKDDKSSQMPRTILAFLPCLKLSLPKDCFSFV